MRGRVFLAISLLGVALMSCTQERPRVGPGEPLATLRPGDIAPGFSLSTSDGGSLTLTEFRGRSPVLLYFSMGPG